MALLTRLRAMLQRRRVARELDDELAFHVEMETEAHISRGVAPAEARRRALADFGGVVQAKESVREVRTLSIESLWQDVRYAARTLGAAPLASPSPPPACSRSRSASPRRCSPSSMRSSCARCPSVIRTARADSA
jgi:hypothetical protein